MQRNHETEVTIKDVPVGTYYVTEQDGWSWRYVVGGKVTNENADATLNETTNQNDDSILVTVDAKAPTGPDEMPLHIVTYNADGYEVDIQGTERNENGKLWLSGLGDASYRVEDKDVSATSSTFLAKLFKKKAT